MDQIPSSEANGSSLNREAYRRRFITVFTTACPFSYSEPHQSSLKVVSFKCDLYTLMFRTSF
jgi:hypothetical protein